MESKSTNISWKIMMVPHIATGIFGLIWIIVPSIFLSKFSPIYMGQQWINFAQENVKLSFFISSLGRFYGIMMLLLSCYQIATTLTAFRRLEKWSWYVFLIVNTIGYGSALISDGISDLIFMVIIEAVLLVAAYIGLMISAKAFFKK